MTVWLLMRATGLVALVLLTMTVALGVVATAPHKSRWITQGVHRDVSLLAVSLVAAHVLTSLVDPHVPIGGLDAVVPFRAGYRPLWVGLGTVATDLLLAVLLSSAVRLRLGGRAWRAVHWLAYAAWPFAVLHAAGTGTDARVVGALAAGCVAGVVVVLSWRVWSACAS